jgi:tyrosyl-tRNA synthetase
VGTDGVRRMGKSLGNYIGVAETAENQFGKVMSLPDEPMRQYFTLLTDLPLAEVDRLLGTGVNPRDAKEALGKAIVTQYHGPVAAEAAAEGFRQRAKGGIDLSEIATAMVPRSLLNADGSAPVGKLLQAVKLAASGSEGSRLAQQGGVWTGEDRQPVERDAQAWIKVENGLILGVGKGNKARAVRIVIAE